VNSFDTLRILHRQRSDRRHSVAAVRGKSLKVGNYTCTAAGIESRNAQQDWRRHCGVSVRAHRWSGFLVLTPTATKIAGTFQKRLERTGNCDVRAEFSERKKNLNAQASFL